MLKTIALLKMTLICRECNTEIHNDDDNPQHELTNHYDKFHIKLFDRCDKCLQRLYGGYHFKENCLNRLTYLTLPVPSYIGYTDINKSVNNNKYGDVDLNKA